MNCYHPTPISSHPSNRAENSTLKVLYLYENEDLTSGGWRNFFGILKDSRCSLQQVNLSENEGMDCRAMEAMSSAISHMSDLRVLDLDDMSSVLGGGWRAAAAMVGCRNASLTDLNLTSNLIDDTSAVALFEAVAGSPTLEKLRLRYNRFIGDAGWKAFKNCAPSLTSLKVLELSHNSKCNRNRLLHVSLSEANRHAQHSHL